MISNILLSMAKWSGSGIIFERGEHGLRVLVNQCPTSYREKVTETIEAETGYDLSYSYNPEQDESNTVVFVQETKENYAHIDGIGTYRVYRANSAKAARDFLTKNPVNEKLLYLVVETPDGNFCRDIMGIYKER